MRCMYYLLAVCPLFKYIYIYVFIYIYVYVPSNLQVFPKGSPLVPEISRAIAKLRQEGKLMEIEEAWFRNNTRSSSNIMRQQDYYSSTIPSPNTLNLDSFRGLFLVSGLSSALALLIFLICNLRPHVKDYILRNLFLGKLLFMLRHIYIEEILLP